MLAIEFHCLFCNALLVTLVFLFQKFELWLELLHFLLCFYGLVCEWMQCELYEQGNNQNDHSNIRNDIIECYKEIEYGLVEKYFENMCHKYIYELCGGVYYHTNKKERGDVVGLFPKMWLLEFFCILPLNTKIFLK